MKLWVCGQSIRYDDDCKAWEFQGVFSTEQGAIDACLTDQYFVGSAMLNETWPEEQVIWPGSYYPKAET